MIAGPRVTLRAIERDDVPIIHVINNDIEVELAGGGDPPYPQSLARAYADLFLNSAEIDPRRNRYREEALEMFAMAAAVRTPDAKRIKWLQRYLDKNGILE